MTVELLPSNQIFEMGPCEIVLDAAIRQSIQVAYTCRSGTCRTCLFQVKEGTVEQIAPRRRTIAADQGEWG